MTNKQSTQPTFETFVDSKAPVNTLKKKEIIKENIEQIKKSLKKGHRFNTIHNYFIEYFKIKCSYSYFTKIVNELSSKNSKKISSNKDPVKSLKKEQEKENIQEGKTQ